MQVAYEKLDADSSVIFHYREFKLPRFNSPIHLHDEYELILILKSHGKLYIGNNVANFKAGELYFFAPGLPHCFYNVLDDRRDSNLGSHALVLWFRSDFLGPLFFERSESAKLNKLLARAKRGIQFCHPSKILKKRIVGIDQKKGIERLIDLLLILNDISSDKSAKLLSIGDILPVNNMIDSKIINDVFRYVAENFQKGISLENAASIAHMQKSAFCRYFKRRTKKTFTKIVNETRIMHAQKLLSETDKTAYEIAFECGYVNTSYFNRQFKQYCKIPPLAFRELLNQK